MLYGSPGAATGILSLSPWGKLLLLIGEGLSHACQQGFSVIARLEKGHPSLPTWEAALCWPCCLPASLPGRRGWLRRACFAEEWESFPLQR